MPFVLIIFLTIACLPDVESYIQPPWIGSTGLSALLTWSMAVGLILYAAVVSRSVNWRLRRDPGQRDLVVQRYERARKWHTLGLFASYILALAGCGWGWWVRENWQDAGGRLLPLPELVILAPFLVPMVVSWLFWYDAERACSDATQHILEGYPAAQAMLDSEATLLNSRWGYFVFQLRHKLALVCIPLTLLIGQKEFRRMFPATWQEWQIVLQLVGVALVFVFLMLMPLVMRFLLGLRPLAPGPLRDRLLATAKRMCLGATDILVWNTRGGMANAMVIGLVPWLRYVIFTDRLLEEFPPEEVEAVLGHEIGHVHHRHMLLYLVFLMLSMTVLGGLIAVGMAMLAPDIASGEAQATWALASTQYLEILPMMLALMVYVFVVFGFLSRRCERQADIHGCRAVSCDQADCLDHAFAERPTSNPLPLCPTGIRTFIQALERVALVNGISRDRPGFLQSWQHASIARRVLFLEQMRHNPSLEPAFQRRLTHIKWGLFGLLGGMLLLLAGILGGVVIP